jgi:hypothetical protein
VSVATAQENLRIIDGRVLSNDGNALPYRPVVEFNRGFQVSSVAERNVVGLNIVPTTIGSGAPIVTHFSTNTLWSRSLRAGGNISLHTVSDGSLLIADAATREWRGEFSAGDWEQIGTAYRMMIPYSMHKVARDCNLVASVRDGDGYAVPCNVKVEKSSTVTLYSWVAFGGNVLIYGGLSPLIAADILTNPMTACGDIIYAADDRGTPDQALCADESGRPWYKTLGSAACIPVNIPGGLPQLDLDGSIPPEFLFYDTMSYRGTFGTGEFTTGGDLPTSCALDGDTYVCATEEYHSEVAGADFTAGQQAIFNGASWDAVPIAAPIGDGVTVGALLPYAGTAASIPPNYLT